MVIPDMQQLFDAIQNRKSMKLKEAGATDEYDVLSIDDSIDGKIMSWKAALDHTSTEFNISIPTHSKY